MSRFNNNYGQTHWAAVIRIFRYLPQTAMLKLVYSKSNKDLVGFCNSDWGGDKRDLKPTTGYTFVLSGAAISWNSKKLPTVAKSTTEAEYMALSKVAAEAVWVKELLKKLVHQALDVVKIFCDNKGANDLARNPGYRPKPSTLLSSITSSETELLLEIHVATTNMVADCLKMCINFEMHLKHGVGEIGHWPIFECV